MGIELNLSGRMMTAEDRGCRQPLRPSRHSSGTASVSRSSNNSLPGNPKVRAEKRFETLNRAFEMAGGRTQSQGLRTQALDTTADTVRGVFGAFHASGACRKINNSNKIRV